MKQFHFYLFWNDGKYVLLLKTKIDNDMTMRNALLLSLVVNQNNTSYMTDFIFKQNFVRVFIYL